jgi:transposase
LEVTKQPAFEEDHVRVATAFNKMLGLNGTSVASVTFVSEGVVIGLRRRSVKHRCPCGWKTWAIYDRSVRRWRHLDLGATKCFLEAEIARIDCRRCGRVRTEEVPWARPGARHTRDFQDVVAWLAQRVDKTTITRLLRVSWEAVSKIVIDVVADAIDANRLNGIFRIGVDEISYRKGYRYLTVVADHDREGAVIWAGDGKGAATLEAFYDELGEERTAQLEAVSMDLGRAYPRATNDKAPQATQCADPFHVVKLANKAVDDARLWAWNEERRRHPAVRRPPGRPPKDAPRPGRSQSRFVKHTRWALLKDPTICSNPSWPSSMSCGAPVRCSIAAGSSRRV